MNIPRTAEQQLHDMCKKLDEQLKIKLEAGVPKHFLVFVVRNGLEDGDIEFDRMGLVFSVLQDAQDALECVKSVTTQLCDANYYDTHVLDIRTESGELLNLLCEIDAHDIKFLRQQADERAHFG